MNGIRKLLRVTKTPCLTQSDKSQNPFVTPWTTFFSIFLTIVGELNVFIKVLVPISFRHISVASGSPYPTRVVCASEVVRCHKNTIKQKQDEISQHNVRRILRKLGHNNCEVARSQNAGVNRTEVNRRIATPYASI